MSQALELSEHDRSQITSADFLGLLRAELADVAREIVAEIKQAIPEYDRPERSAYDQILRHGIGLLLASFADMDADPAAATAQRDETCRAFGHFEAVEGRTLDHLQAATRIAFHVAWRRTVIVAERERIPTSVVATTVDAMLVYLDDAVAQARLGYQQATCHADVRRREERRRLLHLILQRPAVVPEAIEDLAKSTGWWPLPAEATLVAIHPEAPCTRSALDADVLIDFDSAEPCLLVPGPLTAERHAMLHAALADASCVLGLTLPLERATHSLRWARRVLALAEEGVIPDASLIPCQNHLMTMWLLSDPPLIEELTRRHLEPLREVSDGQRKRLVETLAESVTTRATAVDIGERLKIHPQTVRYRLRQLESYLGDSLEDADARFSLDATLRAASLYRRRRPGRRSVPGDR
ncbi:helix-turn-helix domain-containing protein [Actinomadura madurae]|uniref:PucR family transcriptional regulator n=1 Tax=Actinomadura madurae TaxID=1993 RepID=UPI00202709D7|nr:PucR family transcriptional regulator [Actinomadura madurae]MCP9970481.1 helix-turn-helix domain-containing protein [Actinomadura madurae]MCP9982961.1 helix-turn-helix domain-containing protein [Actinomadura madurae]MCQ0005488.1 helix-turn-helix domain-containing protein [Actinomadura madurae]MCQ0019197.1 helix-turn-helix domain-containing protein [Actinomadura madurae]URM99210.1 helix-turn-helix domain-containing protein [Actinomadura madurae]